VVVLFAIIDKGVFSMSSYESEQELLNTLSDKEKNEIEKIVDEMQAVYLYIEKNKLYKEWMHDSERFMGFTFGHTRELVRQSITLGKLTTWLVWLTAILAILTLVNILILIF
jgi:hypothetical protein